MTALFPSLGFQHSENLQKLRLQQVPRGNILHLYSGNFTMKYLCFMFISQTAMFISLLNYHSHKTILGLKFPYDRSKLSHPETLPIWSV